MYSIFRENQVGLKTKEIDNRCYGNLCDEVTSKKCILAKIEDWLPILFSFPKQPPKR